MTITFYDEDNIPEEIEGINVIQDLTIAMDCLNNGETIAKYEFGGSMSPILASGQFCKLIPFKEGMDIKQGDCVFVDVNMMVGTHMVWMISESDGKKYYCIATTKGNIIGWTDKIIAKAVGIPYIVKDNPLKHSKISLADLESSMTSTFLSGRTFSEQLRPSRESIRYGYRRMDTSISTIDSDESEPILEAEI